MSYYRQYQLTYVSIVPRQRWFQKPLKFHPASTGTFISHPFSGEGSIFEAAITKFKDKIEELSSHFDMFWIIKAENENEQAKWVQKITISTTSIGTTLITKQTTSFF